MTKPSPWMPPAEVIDQRIPFAGYFRRALHGLGLDDDAAGAWLDLAGDATGTLPDAAAVAQARTLVIIPGMFGECVARWTQPFGDAFALLRARGHRIHVIDVAGRSSSACNGRTIDAWMREHIDACPDPVVIAYSKGATDFMHAAVLGAGGWLPRITALVTVAGVINGTPLAAAWAERLESWLEAVDVPSCDSGDGKAVDSQTYAEAGAARDAYLGLDRRPRSFAVVAVTDAASVNPMLAALHEALSETDVHNDGQVLAADAVLPGSQLLAAARADHWSIALPFETSGVPMQLLGRNNHFPRSALLLAILQFIAAAPLSPASRDPI